ncbi:MAG: hypothetical protein P8Y69_08675 [Gammaproteobacteria bacterium]
MLPERPSRGVAPLGEAAQQVVSRRHYLGEQRLLGRIGVAVRSRALEIQSLFDDEFGPSIRRAVLSITMQDLGYLSDMFSAGRYGPVRTAYRLTMPLAAGLIRKGNGLDEPHAYDHGMDTIGTALGWIESQAGPGGYLVGDAFTVADLTAASMLAAVANPPDSPVSRPQNIRLPQAEISAAKTIDFAA